MKHYHVSNKDQKLFISAALAKVLDISSLMD